MADQGMKSVEVHPSEVGGELTKHQKVIIDYAAVAVSAVNKGQTEEIVARTHHHIKNEIHDKFEQYARVTGAQKIAIGLGAIVSFAAGFFLKGLLTPRMEEGSNHVDE